MIFVGDIALPFKNAIDYNDVLCSELHEKEWFGGLEGTIIPDRDNTISAVFNSCDAIKELTSKLNFAGFALANNHIFDVGNNYHATRDFLSQINLPFCGIGEDIDEAGKSLLLRENDIQILILNFGWEVIQCKIASKRATGVNPLTKKHVLDSICDAVSQYPNAKIIPFMHWSYELEAEPQPFERELARKMIDMGAAGVIGSHPHRIGGFEIYKEKPIVYSLGNWLFKQNYYFGGRLSFPDFCNEELAFEWDFKSGEYQFHFFEYDRERSALTYLRTEGKESKTMFSYTPFRDLTNSAYKIWYKQNHYHKRKGLPIYYWEDSQSMTRYKNQWNKTRDKLLKVIFKKGK